MSGIESHEWQDGGDHDDKPACIGQWCCGCAEHPSGKPWGWNWYAWSLHYLVCPSAKAQAWRAAAEQREPRA